MSFGSHITRRDFLNGALVTVGGVVLGCRPSRSASQVVPVGSAGTLGPDWYGYGGVGDYRFSHGNTPEVVETAHRLRDQGFPADFGRVDSSETYDLVIVGAGLAGLGGALEVTESRREGQTCLMLGNHPIFWGEGHGNEIHV